ncbi:hypothetical protein O181_087315 [Austropuccinia psidii MF-1]|uniref:Uncharacterized protein n=1 Tax=Austropuccinia psidii MF-1 TaxID=1389203 RepID=A0A9Q3IPK5_9BASI|nr:hypothetical protein [Austropuccinia psidii MF-1]
MKDNFKPLTTQLQGNPAVTPSDTYHVQKGKGDRNNNFLIKPKKWTPISTQRARKPQNSASIQGKPPLIASTGRITVINPVLNYEGEFPKAVEQKFVQRKVKGKYLKNTKLLTNTMFSVQLRDLGVSRNQPENRKGLLISRRPRFEQHGEWQDTKGDFYPSNSTNTSKMRTGQIWIKYFSSTNPSKTCSNGASRTRHLNWLQAGQKIGQASRIYCGIPYHFFSPGSSS